MNENGGDYDWSPMSTSSSSSSSSSQPNSSSTGFNGGTNCILHPVSKLDTLAGVAIKYGVEVADIKRINGLVTDLQMFALKTLEIPLPGRHSPSPSLSNGIDTQRPSSSEKTPPRRRHSDFFDSFQSLKLKSSSQLKVSPAMSSLQGYYGLKPADQQTAAEGFEMSVHRRGDLTNRVLSQEPEDNDSDKWIAKVVRRRQKSEADFTSHTPEMLLKEDINTTCGFSTVTGKGLALRPKSASRTSSGVDGEASGMNQSAIALGDSFLADSISGVRKSSSTSCLQDPDNNTISSMRPATNWSLKADFQALSTAAITRPIFDGLPKPISRRNKAAVD
ncbi:peptidoglycan-binding LysM domain-containing protein [Abeliophyllum distichum]|uniref:Peptidoglycan-binding LysM domain-containing protein n=1 Tax=Abeliophyllum distichum TaxID=126358 RepID=A0ABD1U0P9_9LAMI